MVEGRGARDRKDISEEDRSERRTMNFRAIAQQRGPNDLYEASDT
jgi:hypothetical protein